MAITWNHGHHVLITAIECRDRSRPVGVPDVESFAKKCERTGVNQGIIVSAQGFAGSAITKAEACGIICRTLEDAGDFDWLPTPTCAVGYTKNFGKVDFRLIFKNLTPENIGKIYDVSGTEVHRDTLAAMVAELVALPEDADDRIGQLIPVSLQMDCPGWTMKDQQNVIWPIDHILAKTTLQIERSVSPFQLHRYAGGVKSYNFASCDVQIAGLQGQIVMVQKDDREVGIWLIPDEPPLTSGTEGKRSEAGNVMNIDG